MAAILAVSTILAAGAPAPCARPEDAVGALWWVGPREVRQGASAPLDPAWTFWPGAYEAMSPACVKELRSSAPAHVRITRDGRSVSVGKDAPPGLVATVQGRIGAEIIKGEVRVVGANQGPLAGARRQVAIDCDGEQPVTTPVRELRFTAGGEFEVTWEPFETYRDYWGTYLYDPATHRLTLTVTGGNHVPAQLDLDGEARLMADGSLALSGLWLGEPRPGVARTCAYTFAR